MVTEENLIQAVENRRTYFKTESYSMSIGELKNLYEDEELVINPEYQRLFRWTPGQKVRLIESVLMGIPIPTIFVYQDNNGKWEIVDGLQRVSTFLQFMGALKKETPLVLSGTKYLPEMEGFSWTNFPDSLKLAFRRSKINLTIILSDSDQNAKFEVFQRLNTGGSNASNQEIRDNIMVMMDSDKYKWFCSLAEDYNFSTTISISERQEKEQYHKELLLRYIALTQYSYDPKKDVSDFLDEINLKIIEELSKNECQNIENRFKKTFELLNKAYGDTVFKKGQQGKFLESAFEAISIGLSKNIDQYTSNNIDELKNLISNIYEEDFYRNNAGSGSNAKTRISKILPASIEYFKKNK